ncbi:uncharacterized protein LOC127528753 [Erpetoichthys calabaricus]|uniref:uncharacterized protein LOC127528753 n=1 Tax=Erpetoichthys calabaricus TaxID=27687 RepID=UPI0022348369|nr:uncharacterized protein LOC127528753 [Erpetoichthys calabaricus]
MACLEVPPDHKGFPGDMEQIRHIIFPEEGQTTDPMVTFTQGSRVIPIDVLEEGKTGLVENTMLIVGPDGREGPHYHEGPNDRKKSCNLKAACEHERILDQLRTKMNYKCAMVNKALQNMAEHMESLANKIEKLKTEVEKQVLETKERQTETEEIALEKKELERELLKAKTAAEYYEKKFKDVSKKHNETIEIVEQDWFHHQESSHEDSEQMSDASGPEEGHLADLKETFTLPVLLDLIAAFDTVDHGVQLKQLEYEVGIQRCALKWFASYLNGRSMSVNTGSSMTKIRYDVKNLGVILDSCLSFDKQVSVVVKSS